MGYLINYRLITAIFLRDKNGTKTGQKYRPLAQKAEKITIQVLV